MDSTTSAPARLLSPFPVGSPLGEDAADVGFSPEIQLGPADEEVLSGRGIGVPSGDIQQPHLQPAHLSRQLLSEQDGNRVSANQSDRAGMKRQQGRVGARKSELKHAGILQEEGALLGVQQREACEIHLACVHLGFREVGVDGGAREQVRGDAIEHVNAHITNRLHFVWP